MLKLFFIGLLVLAWSDSAMARGKKGKPSVKQPTGQAEKNIDFEGDVVEGLNRRPLDSLTTTSEDGNRLGMGHTYRRQKSFEDESQELCRELAETY